MFRLNTNVEKKDRSVVTLRDFKGLDTVHSHLNLSYKHATDMRNLINRNGVNRKRKGWRQEKAFAAGETPAGTWSGVVDFSDDGTDKAEIVIHFAYNASGALSISAYKTEDGAEISITNHFTLSSPTGQEIRAVYFETVEGSVTKGKVYAVGAGEILVIEPEKSGETYSLNVMDFAYISQNFPDKYYIPTTVILGATTFFIGDFWWIPSANVPMSFDTFIQICGDSFSVDTYDYPTETNPAGEDPASDRLDNIIPFTERGFDYLEDAASKGKYEAESDMAAEKINALTQKVLNTSTIQISEEDRSLNTGDEKKLKIKIFRANEMEGYNNKYWDGSWTGTLAEELDTYFTARDNYFSGIKLTISVQGKIYKTFTGFTQQKVSTDAGDIAVFIPAEYGQTDAKKSWNVCFCGKNLCIDVGNLVSRLGNSDEIPSGATQFDFGISFVRRNDERSAQLKEILENSTMVTLFGAEGNPNRMFFSGGDNRILYSEYRNPLYIGSQNTITLGSTPITGWIKGTETSLYVFKKYSRQEENLYVIEGELVTSEENKYNVDEGEVVFRNHGYSLPESCVNQDCACSLANDVLVVSDDGVYGITLSANVASTERFARSRAEQIKNLLAEHDLTKAKCVVWDNKMFLAVDGLVFVADARFRASFDGDMSDTFNYEWWLWDNIPLKYWLVIQNKLCFVTEDNRLCCFYDGFSDYIQDELLVAVVDSSGLTAGGVTISSQYAEYNKIKFNNAFRECVPGVMRRGTSGGLIIANSYLYKDINEGDTIYFDFPNGRPTDPGWNMATPVQENVPYIVSDINIQTGEVHFETIEGEEIGFLPLPIGQIGSDAILISKAADEEYNLRIDTEAADNNAYITDAEGEEVELIEYNAVSSYSATLYKKFPVVAYWQTGSYDFGSSIYSKTMERFSVAFDRESPKQLKLYYSTAYGAAVDPVKREIKNLRKNPDFDFGMFSFLRFAFDKKFETSYTRRFFINSFNFISFLLMSDEAEDFAVDSLSFTYKLKQLNRGEQ